MTEEDFEDDDFEDEFDFVDDEETSDSENASAKQESAKASPTSNNQQPSGNRKGVIAIAAIVVLVGSYYGFDMLSKSSEPQTDTVAAKPKDSNTTKPGPLPPPVASNPDSNTDSVVEEDLSIDFADAFAENTQPELTDAVPANPQTNSASSTKTFQQMQQELQSSNIKEPKTPAENNTVKMQVPEEINAALDSISEEMNLNVKQIRQLETSISAIVNSIDQLNRTLSAMDNRVLSLTETVDGLSKDLLNVKKIIIEEDLDLTAPATVKFTNKKQTESITSNAPSYTVHAIIPGRAWLKSSGGQIITVREGDKVGDYGTVAVIDAGNGLVRTSSGITFR